MKRHYINGILVSKVEFERQLRRCCERIDWAGLRCDVTKFTGLKEKLNQGWTYTCLHPVKNIRKTFHIEEKSEGADPAVLSKRKSTTAQLSP